MKFSMEQHREMLANSRDSLRREEAALARQAESVERRRRMVEIYQIKFDSAVARKKDGFDPELFMKELK